VGFGLNNKNVSTPIPTIAATSPDTSRIRDLLVFFAKGVRTAAVAGAAEAPKLELTGAAVANVLPQDWQNVESSGRVDPQKRQNIWRLRMLKVVKDSDEQFGLTPNGPG
jgi:hypothetical protein